MTPDNAGDYSMFLTFNYGFLISIIKQANLK